MRGDIRRVFALSVSLIALYVAAVVATVASNDTDTTTESDSSRLQPACALDGNSIGDNTIVGDSTCQNKNKNTNTMDSNSDRTTKDREQGLLEQQQQREAIEEEDYETAEVEWCRRRPTWRRNPHVDAGTTGLSPDLAQIRERCSKIIGYTPDLELLTEIEDPVLSSTLDIAKWEKDPEFREQIDKSFYEEDFEGNLILEEGYKDLPVLERPLLQYLANCMDEELARMPPIAESPGNNNGGAAPKIPKPRVSALHKRKFDGLPVMAVVENALAEPEARAVLALSQCIRDRMPSQFEKRNFERTLAGGGNDVTFLAGFLQLLAPGVGIQIQKTAKVAYEAAQWNQDFDWGDIVPIDAEEFVEEHEVDEDTGEVTEEIVEALTEETRYSTSQWPDPVTECGIRTTEHLSYSRWKGLSFHEDAGSDYTVLVALSDPGDYEGGAFSLCPDYDGDSFMEGDKDSMGGKNCPGKISVKPNKYAAIVFVSEVNHGVEPILSEGRVMFANELWRYGHVPATMMRPGPADFVLNEDDDDEYWDGFLVDGQYPPVIDDDEDEDPDEIEYADWDKLYSRVVDSEEDFDDEDDDDDDDDEDQEEEEDDDEEEDLEDEDEQ